MLASHKIADTCLLIGGTLFVYAFFLEGILKPIMFYFLLFSVGISLIIFGLGSSADELQFGTTLSLIPFTIISLVSIATLCLDGYRTGFDRHKITRLLAISWFFISGNLDSMNTFGLANMPMLFSIGMVGAIFGLAVAVNQNIEQIYIERNQLLLHLEEKVVEKTKDLSEALLQLKTTQSELVQSARLASLGTLSAGIAHEINNSINFVNGALGPLEKRLQRILPEEEKGQVQKLLNAIRAGTTLTVEIVKSLRNFTGLNQAAFKDVLLKDTVQSILLILKSKLNSVQVHLDLPADIKAYGNLVGINQIFMNLISNAIDAMTKENSEIFISALEEGEEIKLTVRDNGAGIPPEVVARIFDPFFTTKEVGKGTGLGLHIVHKEIQRHHGRIAVASEINVGTTFTIYLPKSAREAQIQEAA